MIENTQEYTVFLLYKEYNDPTIEKLEANIWDLRYACRIREFLFAFEDSPARHNVSRVIDAYEQRVLPRLPNFRRGILYSF